MSSCSRRAVLTLIAAAPLAACDGFVPAFGPDSGGRALMNRVAVADPADKNAFDLVQRIEERLGRAVSPAYALSYEIVTDQVDLGVTPANAITRYNITGSVSFTLTGIATKSVLSSGTASTFTAFSASGTTVSTDASRADAYQRLMRLLADQVVARLVIAVGSRAPG